MIKKILLFFFLFLGFSFQISAQVELVPVSNNVYDFLKQMQVKGVIKEYNSSYSPVDRRTVFKYLEKINARKEELSSVDKKILAEALTEFNPAAVVNDSLAYSFFNSPSVSNIFDNSRQKYLYMYKDSSVSFYVDGAANASFRSFEGDSFSNSIAVGELGLRFRGTLFNHVGYYLRLSNGQQVYGGYEDRVVAAGYDPKLSSNVKFINEKYFDSFEGYLRYAADGNWLALTIGREALTYGFGYIDKLFISTNAAPFDFIKLDLEYKAISYSFMYGSIKGDSLGVSLDSKNVVSNSLNLNFGRFKFGFFETIIVANRQLSFTYLNPINFLISADFSYQKKNDNNALCGFNMEIVPFNNLALQGTLLIDDLDFSTLFKDESMRDNKFGLQAGLMWNEFLTLSNLKFTAEYTKIYPYVYTHRTNKTTYSHWDLSLGHHLPPNSDEIIGKLDYNFSQRIRMSASFAYQRSADGIVLDSKGTLIRNYGGSLLRGDGDLLFIPEFLAGYRYDKKTLSFDLYLEPVKQYYIKVHYSKILTDVIYLNQNLEDDILYCTVGVDF